MTKIEVRKVWNRDGYRVHVDWLPSHDDFYECLWHDTIFTDRARAERLAEKIRQAVREEPYRGVIWALDLDHWFWHPSRASYCGALQVPSKAVERII